MNTKLSGRRFWAKAGLALLCALLGGVGWVADARAAGKVRLMRVPNGGLQPQVVTDASGVVHLIYLKGDPAAADVFYCRMEAGAAEFSAPLRVNSESGSAIAVGTIRGAQLAVGRGGRAHVAWNGSNSATPKPARGTPMLYARLNDAGTAFEAQRNLIAAAAGLDGGGTVAADAAGNVYVLWHAPGTPESKGEAQRAVFVAVSRDDGRTFAAEWRAHTQPTGACGCCGMKATVDGAGILYAVYRSANAEGNRDMQLITSQDQGRSFAVGLVDPWLVKMCPMSSAALAPGAGGVLVGWETGGQVMFGLAGKGTEVNGRTPLSELRGAKHPALVPAASGELLGVWTQGTGWQRGGSLAWQIFDKSGRPTAEKGTVPGVPVWSFAAAFAWGGGFTVLY